MWWNVYIFKRDLKALKNILLPRIHIHATSPNRRHSRCLFQHLFIVFAFPRVLIVHNFCQEMTQHKHKLALHSVYCCLNAQCVLFRYSHASRNGQSRSGHSGGFVISFVTRRDAQTDMATAIPAFVRLTKLGSHGQQFVSCPPLGEERKWEKVREREWRRAEDRGLSWLRDGRLAP